MPSPLRSLLALAAVGLARKYRRQTVRLVQLESAKLYVKGIQATRLSLMALLGLTFLVNLFTGSFLLLQVALVVNAPWTLEQRLLVIIIGNALYGLGALLILLFIFREKLWMKMTGGNRIVHQALHQGLCE